MTICKSKTSDGMLWHETLNEMSKTYTICFYIENLKYVCHIRRNNDIIKSSKPCETFYAAFESAINGDYSL